ncbi:hypothetical protein BS78_08G079300 [Paspalum vaginatum]|nr:hypothetical protein BS78_08G079300 [Paspalum vaginatum]
MTSLYAFGFLERKKVQDMKRLLAKFLKADKNQENFAKFSKDAFTRFSVKTFASVVDSLDEHQKLWLARHVNVELRQIIVKGKVVPLTAESVHMILGLPIGGAPFPSDSNHAKSKILSLFGKVSMLQVNFFANKLIKKECKSDEETFICFMLVALNSFLCLNSSLVPSSAYLSAFEDVEKTKDFDWSRLVLYWLLVKIKEFTRGKSKTNKTSQSYSVLDSSGPGQYGSRGILDVQKPYFDKLDELCGGKLPEDLSNEICSLVAKFMSSSRPIPNLDMSYIAPLHDELKTMVSALLNHVFNIDVEVQQLVLSVLKICLKNGTACHLAELCAIDNKAPIDMNISEGYAYDSHSITPTFINKSYMATNQNPAMKKMNQFQFMGNKSSSSSVREMTNKSPRNVEQPEIGVYFDDTMQKNSSSGGKIGHYGSRRLIRPTSIMRTSYETNKSAWLVTSSEYDNYEAICVRCTFWSLGQSLMQRGSVNNFVNAAFCRHLFLKPNEHPDVSKSYYFFPNLLYINKADQNILMRAFTRSTKARPLQNSNMIYHWFLFIVDIKNQSFVFLDSHYSSQDDFHSRIRERLINTFAVHWEKYVKVEKQFHQYNILYPGSRYDSSVYTMMGLQYWTSSRTILSSIFQPKDAPKIRVKIANKLVFNT